MKKEDQQTEKEQLHQTPVSGCAIPVIIVIYNDSPWIVEELNLSYDYNKYAIFKGNKPKYWAEEIDRDNTIDCIIENTGLYWTEADETNYKRTIEILDAIIEEHEKVKKCFRQKYDKSLSLQFLKHCH
ncbi:MAG: hypothetical protein KGZ58_06820 [Ignavibacteriales bacterium]|nr:hypothetical protein [Ignavibacteriales bacterium]